MLFAILTLLSALSVAGVAGWFSIVGVMSIYAGAPLNAALIMGMTLEGAKLVTISWLYRNWSTASWALKGPLVYFMVALMVATSIGVFGFLTKAHLEQGAATIDNAAKVERLDQQIAREKATIADNEKVIAQLDTAINSFLGNDKTDRALSVRRAQAPQRKQLRDEIQAAQKQIDVYSEERLKLTSEVRALQLEVGPIKYIADLFYGSSGNESSKIEAAVTIFTLLIVSTLDPLAVILLIAANHTMLRIQREKEEINKKSPGIIKHDIVEEKTNKDENTINPGQEETSYTPNDTPLVLSPIPSKAVDEEIPKIKTEKNIKNVALDETAITNKTVLKHETADEIYLSELNDYQSAGSLFPEFAGEYKKEDDIEIETVVDNRETKILDIEPAPEEIESIKNVKYTQPWAHNEEVLSGLLGNQPHFIPTRIDEPRKESVSESAKEKTLDKLDDKLLTDNKYPKALSWINEFKGN